MTNWMEKKISKQANNLAEFVVQLVRLVLLRASLHVRSPHRSAFMYRS